MLVGQGESHREDHRRQQALGRLVLATRSADYWVNARVRVRVSLEKNNVSSTTQADESSMLLRVAGLG